VGTIVVVWLAVLLGYVDGRRALPIREQVHAETLSIVADFHDWLQNHPAL
jgi:hypothetical protein